MRTPVLPETHEVLLFDAKRCCDKGNALELAYQVQLAQSVTGGYFGGYSAKMQDVGRRELESIYSSLGREIEALHPVTLGLSISALLLTILC